MQIKVLYFVLGSFRRRPEQRIESAFSHQYPHSEYPLWERTEDGSWQVNFNDEFRTTCAFFGENGNWLGSRWLTHLSLLSKELREKLELQFNGGVILKIYVLKFRKTELYELLLLEDEQVKTLLFTQFGNLLCTEDAIKKTKLKNSKKKYLNRLQFGVKKSLTIK